MYPKGELRRARRFYPRAFECASARCLFSRTRKGEGGPTTEEEKPEEEEDGEHGNARREGEGLGNDKGRKRWNGTRANRVVFDAKSRGIELKLNRRERSSLVSARNARPVPLETSFFQRLFFRMFTKQNNRTPSSFYNGRLERTLDVRSFLLLAATNRVVLFEETFADIFREIRTKLPQAF